MSLARGGDIKRRLCIPGIYGRVRLWLGLTWSYNNESDWLFPRESTRTYPMILENEINVRSSVMQWSIVYSNTLSTKIGTCRNSDILQIRAAPKHRQSNTFT